jgi:uncharacterized Rossmann fold enzyme
LKENCSLQSWKDIYNQAVIDITNREEKCEEAANLIETKLTLLGATAIEDQLQDKVFIIIIYRLCNFFKIKNIYFRFLKQ